MAPAHAARSSAASEASVTGTGLDSGIFGSDRVDVDPDLASAIERGGNKRCSNARLLASGFALRSPDYQTGYGEMLSSA